MEKDNPTYTLQKPHKAPIQQSINQNWSRLLMSRKDQLLSNCIGKANPARLLVTQIYFSLKPLTYFQFQVALSRQPDLH